jgi:hypothetical protein
MQNVERPACVLLMQSTMLDSSAPKLVPNADVKKEVDLIRAYSRNLLSVYIQMNLVGLEI